MSLPVVRDVSSGQRTGPAFRLQKAESLHLAWPFQTKLTRPFALCLRPSALDANEPPGTASLGRAFDFPVAFSRLTQRHAGKLLLGRWLPFGSRHESVSLCLLFKVISSPELQ